MQNRYVIIFKEYIDTLVNGKFQERFSRTQPLTKKEAEEYTKNPHKGIFRYSRHLQSCAVELHLTDEELKADKDDNGKRYGIGTYVYKENIEIFLSDNAKRAKEKKITATEEESKTVKEILIFQPNLTNLPTSISTSHLTLINNLKTTPESQTTTTSTSTIQMKSNT